jgi:hypothetical protein
MIREKTKAAQKLGKVIIVNILSATNKMMVLSKNMDSPKSINGNLTAKLKSNGLRRALAKPKSRAMTKTEEKLEMLTEGRISVVRKIANPFTKSKVRVFNL